MLLRVVESGCVCLHVALHVNNLFFICSSCSIDNLNNLNIKGTSSLKIMMSDCKPLFSLAN